MITSPALDQLGGRLELLRPEELDDPVLDLHRRLVNLIGAESAAAGYRAQLDDGRLLGPFNSMLYAPALTEGLAQWVRQINDAGIDAQVREAIILTVGGRWQAPFEIYAHTAAGRTAGLSEEAIADLVGDRAPTGAADPVVVAHRLTHALVVDHAVSADLYQDAVRAFTIEGTIACLHLIAQYQFIASVLTFFDVPVPTVA